MGLGKNDTTVKDLSRRDYKPFTGHHEDFFVFKVLTCELRLNYTGVVIKPEYLIASVFLVFMEGCLNMTVQAAGIKVVDPIEAHYPIISVEKDVNPQNIMIVYTKLDKDCSFIVNNKETGSPTIDFYWLMDRRNFKVVHPLIKSGIAERIKLDSIKDPKKFTVKLNDIREIETDIPAAEIVVTAKTNSNKKCSVESFMQLGPSDQNKEIRLDTIYSESEQTLAPPFRKVTHITLKGVDRKTGKKISRRY